MWFLWWWSWYWWLQWMAIRPSTVKTRIRFQCIYIVDIFFPPVVWTALEQRWKGVAMLRTEYWSLIRIWVLPASPKSGEWHPSSVGCATNTGSQLSQEEFASRVVGTSWELAFANCETGTKDHNSSKLFLFWNLYCFLVHQNCTVTFMALTKRGLMFNPTRCSGW